MVDNTSSFYLLPNNKMDYEYYGGHFQAYLSPRAHTYGHRMAHALKWGTGGAPL